MRVYIAAPWTHKPAAIAAAVAFEQAGFTVTKRWWEHRDTTDIEELAIQAIEDIAGVFNANWFVLLNLEKSEGKAVETGLALAYGTPIIVVGKPTNLFHYLPGTRFADTVEDAIQTIQQGGHPRGQ